jgi:cytochrome bd-type quinol oxidase subunit 2
MFPVLIFYLLPYVLLYSALKDAMKVRRDNLLTNHYNALQTLLALLGILEIVLSPMIMIVTAFIADSPDNNSIAMTAFALVFAYQPLCWGLFFWRMFIRKKVTKQNSYNNS